MVDFVESIKLPITNIKDTVIGIILMAIPIISFLAVGYIYETAKNTMKGKTQLAEWTNWSKLFIQGLLAIIIGIIYMLPALIVLVAFVGLPLLTALPGILAGDATAVTTVLTAQLSTLGIGIILTIILAIFAVLWSPIAILHYINTGKFGAAFNLGTVTKKVLTGTYIISFIVGVVYLLIVSFILGLIPFVGTFIGSYLGTLSMTNILAAAYKETK